MIRDPLRFESFLGDVRAFVREVAIPNEERTEAEDSIPDEVVEEMRRRGYFGWSIPEDFMTMSGVLATGGDVVFYGTTDGWFRAVDARSGRVLWSQKLSSGITSQPIAYLGPDGREYIAVIAGVGGVASQVMGRKNGFPPRGGVLYVFSIDGVSPMSGQGLISTVGAGAPAAHYDTGD